MFMKIIMFAFCYPILPIMYFILKNELEPHKNIILGVALYSSFPSLKGIFNYIN